MSGAKFESKNAMNVVWNLVDPFYSHPSESALQILADTIVEAIVRKVLKTPQPWKEIAATHAVSMPFRGAPFVLQPGRVFDDDQKFSDQVMQGMMQAPSILFAQYLKETARQGLHLPKPVLWDIISITIAQAVSAPAMMYVSKWFPEAIGDRVAVLKAMYQKQKETGPSHTEG
jgi:hypothetical protein